MPVTDLQTTQASDAPGAAKARRSVYYPTPLVLSIENRRRWVFILACRQDRFQARHPVPRATAGDEVATAMTCSIPSGTPSDGQRKGLVGRRGQADESSERPMAVSVSGQSCPASCVNRAENG
jgi:hypothetical protein